MSLYICSLNSGSNGNCYYVGTASDAVLIDAGISCRETEKRMKRAGLHIENVRAVFISHEHADHIRGVETLVKKYALPLYITPDTYSYSRLKVASGQVTTFAPYAPVSVAGLEVTAFPKFHDASDPYSFIVSHQGVKVGVLTDIGSACEHVIRNFSECHAAFLEANYDEKMLDEGGYPAYLKRRIRGKHGHLSNDQALELFTRHRGPLSHLLLSHLSQHNNCPKLVQELFSRHAGQTFVSVASRHQESPVFKIDGTFAKMTDRANTFRIGSGQMSLF
jgi:phosphoribosyl 1,2-cyclic phosphodiesterase